MNIQHYVLASDNPETLQALEEAAREMGMLTVEEENQLPIPRHIKNGERYADNIPDGSEVIHPDLIIVKVDSYNPADQCPADFLYAQSAYEFFNKKVEVRLLIADSAGGDKNKLVHRFPVLVEPPAYVNDMHVVVNYTADKMPLAKVKAAFADKFFEKPESFARWLAPIELADHLNKFGGLSTVNVLITPDLKAEVWAFLLKVAGEDDRIGIVRLFVIESDGYIKEVAVSRDEPKDPDAPIDVGVEQEILPAEQLPVVFNWPEASRRLQEGKALRRLKWGFASFISVTFGQLLSANKFWSQHNKRAAEANGGSLTVEPYFTKCDGQSVTQWFLTYEDEQANDWVEYDTVSMLHSINGNHFDGFELQYDLFESGLVACSSLYGVLASKNPKVVYIANNLFPGRNAINMSSILTDMKKQLHRGEVIGQRTYLDHISDSDLLSAEHITFPEGKVDVGTIEAKLKGLFDHFGEINIIVLRDYIENDDLDLFSEFTMMLDEIIKNKQSTWATFAISDYMSNNLVAEA